MLDPDREVKALEDLPKVSPNPPFEDLPKVSPNPSYEDLPKVTHLPF